MLQMELKSSHYPNLLQENSNKGIFNIKTDIIFIITSSWSLNELSHSNYVITQWDDVF
jgi:hypothetical protein